MFTSIEIFAIILGLSIIGAIIVACITKDSEVLWFPLLVIIFYLFCGGQAGIFNSQPPTTQTEKQEIPK
jgi:hypothetical protein